MNLRSLDGSKPVFLAGEGENELGGWCHEPQYRENPYRGVLEALLLQVRPNGWHVRGGIRWKDIKKFRAGEHRSAEERNVVGACLMAEENGCTIIAFSRDSDGNKERKREIDSGLSAAQKEYARMGIIGGCAVPSIEGWILAIIGIANTEKMSSVKVKNTLTRQGIRAKNTIEMVACIKREGLVKIPHDAQGLKAWLEKAGKML